MGQRPQWGATPSGHLCGRSLRRFRATLGPSAAVCKVETVNLEASMVLAAEPASASPEGSSPVLPVACQERSLNDPAALQHLVTCFRDGDACAFEDFEPHVFALCYRRARRLGAKHDEAEDVAQEVIVRIWLTRARSFDPRRGSLEGWLGVSCANRLKDLWKRKDRQ